MSIQHFQTKLGITKYSIVTNSNDSVTLRLMTEHDLAMLYEWAKSIHIVEWWAEKKHARHLLTYRNSTCQAFSARVRHSIHCNAEWRADWVCPSYVALGSGDGWWEEETDPGVRNRPVTGECITTGQKAWEPSWFELWELLFNDPEVTKIQTDPSPSNLRAIRCYEKAGV